MPARDQTLHYSGNAMQVQQIQQVQQAMQDEINQTPSSACKETVMPTYISAASHERTMQQLNVGFAVFVHLLVYVIGAETMLCSKLQCCLPLPLTDQADQLVAGAQLGDADHHPPPHHCWCSALLCLAPKRPANHVLRLCRTRHVPWIQGSQRTCWQLSRDAR